MIVAHAGSPNFGKLVEVLFGQVRFQLCPTPKHHDFDFRQPAAQASNSVQNHLSP
ncbi:hypothetical protein GGE61_006418 [Rhizobium leguminosarum]|nr:hypothetical protein [Rhizobium leguminosarum]